MPRLLFCFLEWLLPAKPVYWLCDKPIKRKEVNSASFCRAIVSTGNQYASINSGRYLNMCSALMVVFSEPSKISYLIPWMVNSQVSFFLHHKQVTIFILFEKEVFKKKADVNPPTVGSESLGIPNMPSTHWYVLKHYSTFFVRQLFCKTVGLFCDESAIWRQLIKEMKSIFFWCFTAVTTNTTNIYMSKHFYKFAGRFHMSELSL